MPSIANPTSATPLNHCTTTPYGPWHAPRAGLTLAVCCSLVCGINIKHIKNKTVRIETHSSRFGGTFFLQRTDHVFFQSLDKKNKKLKFKIRHTEPGRYDGRQRPWYILPPVGRPRPFCLPALVDNTMGDAPYRRRHENRAGWMYYPTIYHGDFLLKNRHPGCR